MKIFLDTANLDEIRSAHRWGVLDGVTTNPTLVYREGAEFKSRVVEICDVVGGPVSAEVTAAETDAAGMIREGREIAAWHPHVVVKIPCFPAGLEATRALAADGIRVNMTLVFSPAQALLSAKAGASFVSPFLGRLDDLQHVGMDLVRSIVTIFDNYAFECEVLAASLRHPLHVVDAALAGADIATMPFAVLKQLLQHPLTDLGQARFLEDWKKLQQKLAGS
jgi:transaldolase